MKNRFFLWPFQIIYFAANIIEVFLSKNNGIVKQQ
jgi:hypothetical protein